MHVRSYEELELEIVLLKRQGFSQRSIMEKLKITRWAVRKALIKHHQQREQGHDQLAAHKNQSRASKLDTWVAFIKRKLEKSPDITAVRVLEDLKSAGFDGEITIVRECVRKLRPKPKKEPVIRFETEPGVLGQMDWSFYAINFRRGGKQKVCCFSYILGFSRRHYLDFTTNRNFFSMIRRHRDAFHHFQGVPQKCLYDGEKTVILRWEAGWPVYHPGFVAFLTHYGCRPVGCRPGRPRTKGKVEKPFQSVEGHLLNGREFDDLEDLRRFTQQWLAQYSDQHKHRTTGRTPIDLFMEKERQALTPLPPHPYDTSEIHYLVGYDDGFVRFEANLYSIPFAYMYVLLVLRANEDEIKIYTPDLKVIAHHPRLPKGGGQKSENMAHRESSKDRYGVESIRERFLDLGSHAEEFLAGLIKTHPRRKGLQARRILALREHYEDCAINQAFRRATRYYAFDATSVENILKAKFKPRALESWGQPTTLDPNLPCIQQRSLDEYSFLNYQEEPIGKPDDPDEA